MKNTPQHLMIWDGDCAFCRRSVQLAQRLDHDHQFDYAPYQSAPQVHNRPLTPQLQRACERALHVARANGSWLHGGAAVMFFLETTARSRLLKRLFRIARSFPCLVFVEWGYRLVARNRGFFSRFF